MNDSRIEQLLKLAAEAERMEFGDRVRPATFPQPAPSIFSVRFMSAAAAMLLVGTIGYMNISKAPSSKSQGLIAAQQADAHSSTTREATSSCEDESTVLLALFHKADGIAGRATMAFRNWDAQRGLNDLAEGELLGLAFEHTNELSPDALPDSVVLLAVSGPSSLIPHSDEEAIHLAACLEDTPVSCGGEIPCYTSAALACLPPGVTVRGESRIVR